MSDSEEIDSYKRGGKVRRKTKTKAKAKAKAKSTASVNNKIHINVNAGKRRYTRRQKQQVTIPEFRTILREIPVPMQLYIPPPTIAPPNTPIVSRNIGETKSKTTDTGSGPDYGLSKSSLVSKGSLGMSDIKSFDYDGDKKKDDYEVMQSPNFHLDDSDDEHKGPPWKTPSKTPGSFATGDTVGPIGKKRGRKPGKVIDQRTPGNILPSRLRPGTFRSFENQYEAVGPLGHSNLLSTKIGSRPSRTSATYSSDDEEIINRSLKNKDRNLKHPAGGL